MDVRVLDLILFTACCASFTWSVVGYFQRPLGGKLPNRMRVVAATGIGTMTLHAAGLVFLSYAVGGTSLVLGAICYAGSLALFWWALLTTWHRRFDVAFSERRPQYVMTAGPYRFVRHPLYGAYSLAWIAGAMCIGQWWAWVCVPVMVWQYVAAIGLEERQFLSSGLGPEYLAYRRVTGMLLPFPWEALAARPHTERK